MNEMIKIENNVYSNNYGENLKGPYKTFSNEVKKIDGPVVIDGDLYVKGSSYYYDNFRGNSVSNDDIRRDLDDLRIKCSNIFSGIDSSCDFGIINSLKMERDLLKDRVEKMEKLFSYICNRFSIDMTDISENIDEKMEVLNNRSSAEKRLDIVNMRA